VIAVIVKVYNPNYSFITSGAIVKEGLTIATVSTIPPLTTINVELNGSKKVFL
jgi:hypothetical protein